MAGDSDQGAAPAERTPADLVEWLVSLLDVRSVGDDLFRGKRQRMATGRVFGGQVIAQGLVAASRTIGEGKLPHSLHAYFMRAGNEAVPIDYRVRQDFDGRSFATRRVVALQEDRPILNLAASFQLPEEGLAHQDPMPDVPPPEDAMTEAEWIAAYEPELSDDFRRHVERPRPIEMRPLDPRAGLAKGARPAAQKVWFRAAAALPDDPVVHRAVLAYASDMRLLSTGMLPHGLHWNLPGMQSASLDHAVWFHEEVRADEWLLYVMDSPWTGHARSFNRGQVFSRDGRLVASCAQEGLMRMRS